MMFKLALEGLGFRYLEAPSEERATENAKRIWPNNKVQSVKRAERLDQPVNPYAGDSYRPDLHPGPGENVMGTAADD